MSTVLVQPPDTEGLRSEALTLVDRAKSITIRNNSEHDLACQELQRVARVRKGIVQAFEEPKRKAFEAHRAIVKLETDLLQYPLQAERVIKGAIGAWRTEEEKVRRQEQAKLQETARRQQEDMRMAEAEALANTGHVAEAEALLDEPVIGAVIELPKPDSGGVTTRRKWGWKITDASAIRRDFLIPDEKKIGALVRALGPDAASTICGIEVTEETVVAVRANG